MKRYYGVGLNYIRFRPTFAISLKLGKFRFVYCWAQDGLTITTDRRV